MWFDISIFIFLKFILGEPIKLQTTDSLDDIVGNGIYDIELSQGNPFGKSSNAIMIVSKIKAPYYNGLIMQRAYRNNIYKMRWKWTSGWTSWHDIGIDIPSFYKDYNDLSSLASALGVLVNGTLILSGTFSDITKSGIYGYNHDSYTASDEPANYGVLMVFNGSTAGGGKPIAQMFFASNGTIYTRIKSAWTGNNYSAWRTISFT